MWLIYQRWEANDRSVSDARYAAPADRSSSAGRPQAVGAIIRPLSDTSSFLLRQRGITRVRPLAGGLPGWRRRRFPLAGGPPPAE